VLTQSPPPTIENTVIAFSTPGVGLLCGPSHVPILVCCDIYGNAQGDWFGPIASQYGINGNISADPLFCAPEVGDFTLHGDSPCAPGGECGLIGAWPVGCDPTPTVQTTWGAIKAMHR